MLSTCRPRLCKQSRTRHLTYNLLCLKHVYHCALTSKGRNSPQSFLEDCFLGYNPLCVCVCVCVCVCLCVCPCGQLLSHVQLFGTPWTVARQAHLSMGFPRQEYRSKLPFPTPGDLHRSRDQTSISYISRQIFLPTVPPGKL